MTILFIENRYKTIFWEAIAKELEKEGHKIGWIVQNHLFAPDHENVFKVAYPKKKDLLQTNISDEIHKTFEFIRSTDRLINYFNGDSKHYSYYYNELQKVIHDINPDLVIGESTLFHELMVIDICKKNKILYLNPSSNSYPPGRFSFYMYDTKTPKFGSEEEIGDKECDEYISNISERNIVPDYMIETKNRSDIPFPKAGSFQNRMDILRAYIMGEKYNTPSPLRKFVKDRETNHILKKWNKISMKEFKTTQKKILLLPLQMQPEANLDVWGAGYKNQARLIKRVADKLPPEWIIAVKPNPKSKYEMEDELFEVSSCLKNVFPLHSSISMGDIFEVSSAVITVTGTVAIESILSEKPLALLGPSITEGFKGCKKLEEPEEITTFLSLIEKNEYVYADHNEKRKLIKELVKTSHQGLISDPVSNPRCLSQKNIETVSSAILKALKQMEQKVEN